MRRPVPVLAILVLATLVSACSGMTGTSSSSSTNPSSTADTGAGFARFTDIPMPGSNKIDLDRTIVFGIDRDWIGRIALSTSMSVGDTYDFYKREMTRYGWTELTSVRSATSVLSYQMDNRIATIQVTGQRFGGSQIDFWMNPRAAGGASTFGSPGTFGGPPTAPRGSINQAPLPPQR
jgi:hypothetical protein